MQSPKKGVYISDNGNIKITIDYTDGPKSEVYGSYYHAHTPNEEGSLTVEGLIGHHYYVDGVGTTPYSVCFVVMERKNGGCIIETWNGYYTENDTFKLAGTQSYVNHKNNPISTDFGTTTFSLQVLTPKTV